MDAAERAEAALARRLGGRVERRRSVLEIAAGGFLPGDEAPWVEERRRDVEELRLRALEAWRPPASRWAARGSPTPSARRASRSRRRRSARAATGC